MLQDLFFFFFSSRRRHTRCIRDWSSDVCSSDLEGNILRQLSSSDLGECRKNVYVRGERIAIETAFEGCRPAPERGHARATFIRSDFLSAHTGIEDFHAYRTAVVGHEHDKRLLGDTPLVEPSQ